MRFGRMQVFRVWLHDTNQPLNLTRWSRGDIEKEGRVRAAPVLVDVGDSSCLLEAYPSRLLCWAFAGQTDPPSRRVARRSQVTRGRWPRLDRPRISGFAARRCAALACAASSAHRVSSSASRRQPWSALTRPECARTSFRIRSFKMLADSGWIVRTLAPRSAPSRGLSPRRRQRPLYCRVRGSLLNLRWVDFLAAMLIRVASRPRMRSQFSLDLTRSAFDQRRIERTGCVEVPTIA